MDGGQGVGGVSDQPASAAAADKRADFLLELLSEEIPARMQRQARADLARLFAEAVGDAGIAASEIVTYSTPRRLALIARGLPLETPAVCEEVKGPRSSAPPQALAGFLRKTGLARDQLIERDGVLFATIDKPGRPTAEVLGEAVAAIIRDFPWPKSMRWGAASADSGSLRWVRPLHSIVALLGEEIVPVALEGMASGAATLGHRFHHPGQITIGGAHDYVEKLRACHVVVDQAEREALIRDGARAAAAETGLTLVEDEGLVAENAGLTEWPVALLGRFDADFLDVPREVIVLTMRTNQKYFALTDAAGALAPAFVCTANIAASDDGASIVEGNRRVLAARLSDARFFWQQDLKVPLEEQAAKLGQIVFHEKLGTVADKVKRVANLAEWLVSEQIITGCEPADAKRAAELCKADLVTGMVGEFPELQGVIGGYLAAAQGEPQAVAGAIRDHYKPAGQGDEVPTAPVAVAVALGDKLDSLFAFFEQKMIPTGSKDPFALRRAGLGVLQIIEGSRLRFLLTAAVESRGSSGSLGRMVADFLFDRLAVLLRETGVRHDYIQASRAWDRGNDTDSDMLRVSRRSRALADFLTSGEGADLLAGYKRAANILKKEEGSWAPDQVRGDGEVMPEEQALMDVLEEAELRASAAVEGEDFTAAMAALASLRAPIDSFFDQVTVNDLDPAVRARRLELLARFRDAVHQVADFSKVEG